MFPGGLTFTPSAPPAQQNTTYAQLKRLVLLCTAIAGIGSQNSVTAESTSVTSNKQSLVGGTIRGTESGLSTPGHVPIRPRKAQYIAKLD